MGILRDFEGRLERIVEGFFTKAFRSGVQPVELAKRVLREMDAGKTVGVKEVWVPNRYEIRLSPDDHERLAGMGHALERELAQVVTDGARERGHGLVARPEVTIEPDEALRRGEFQVDTEITEETGAAAAEEAPARLLLFDGGGTRQIALDRERVGIGRLEDSDVRIGDRAASRNHAEIRRRGEQFIIIDLGSTNGTLVNERPVTEQVLSDGDRITIGSTVLEFRRR